MAMYTSQVPPGTAKARSPSPRHPQKGRMPTRLGVCRGEELAESPVQPKSRLVSPPPPPPRVVAVEDSDPDEVPA
eukprot:7409303-Alexandrium_andersonii.AAC.1